MKKFSQEQHAYVVEGNFAEIQKELEEYICQRLGIEHTHHPDVLVYETDTFLVEHSREIQEWQMRKPLIAKKKCCVLVAEQYTGPAQNALLKVLEEPRAQTVFFVVVPSKKGLLETVLSRVEDLSFEKTKSESVLGKTFLSSSIPERLAIISEIIEEGKNAHVLYRDLEVIAQKEKDLVYKKTLTTPLLFVEQKFFEGGASHKNLLEYIAIHLPVQ